MKRSWRMRVALLITALGVSVPVMAQTQSGPKPARTPAEAFEAGKDFARTNTGKMPATLFDQKVLDKLPSYGGEVPERSLFPQGKQDGNPLIGVGESKKTTCASSGTARSSYDSQECDVVNFLNRQHANRPRFQLDPDNDPLLKGSRTTIDNPGPVPGASSQQCRIERISRPATFTQASCSEAPSMGTLTCRRILSVACSQAKDGCDPGGIVPGTWDGDMAVKFDPDGQGNFILQFGTIDNDYWKGGVGTVYDRSLKFEIRDAEKITRFALTRAAFDDWLLVKINDHQVYVGPKGGDRLEIYTPEPVQESQDTRTCYRQGGWSCHDRPKSSFGRNEIRNHVSYRDCSVVPGGWRCEPNDARRGLVRYCETCFSRAELSTSWNFNLNFDLKPYLRNGVNTIFMRTIVARGGEGAIQITTRQMCPVECRDVWDDSLCLPLQKRAEP